MTVDAPSADILQVSVFGRGYGESIAVHTGHGRWLIIDSLKTENGRPAAVEYLESINIDVSTAVDAVLFTHWHDDHVAGGGEMVRSCAGAQIIVSGALQRDEFTAFMRSSNVADAGSFGSGVNELFDVFTAARESKRQIKWAWADKTLAVDRGMINYRFEALSPSEADFEKLIKGINDWKTASGRLKSPARNDASVAAVVHIHDEKILLGADLEITGDDAGWARVHSHVWGDRGKAGFYKIAHHGSPNGDYDSIWADMLVENVCAALAPWNRGSKRPTEKDVARILARTPDAHSASKIASKKSTKRLSTVERSLREANIKIHAALNTTGHVRFRKERNRGWQVDYLAGDSCHLAEVFK